MVKKPEEFHLWLPSALPCQIPCDTKLQEIEWNLHYGQAHNALGELRQALHSHSYMLRFKDRFLRGQGANTRAQNCLKSVDSKVNASAAKYRAAHRAMVALSRPLGKVGWHNTLRFLTNEDIRLMTTGAGDLQSEGHRRVSWIWLMCGCGEEPAEEDGEQDLQDGMSVYLLIRLCRSNQLSSSHPY